MSGALAWNELPGAVVVYDSAGQVTDANRAACQLLGVEASSLIGTSAETAEWLVTDAEDGPVSVHPVTAALKSRQAVRGALARTSRPDGTNVWMQVDAIPEVSSSGDVTGVVATLTDVTHLITRSRLSGRSRGDHIVDEIAERLAHERLDARAILTSVTTALGRLRPGIWVGTLMSKDPNTMRVIASDDSDPLIGRYIEAMQMSGAIATTPISTRVIESGEPLLIPSVAVDGLLGMLTDDLRTYLHVHPMPTSAAHLGLMVVPMRARGAPIGTLGLFERSGSNPLTEKDTIWLQAVADRTGSAIENAQLYEDAVKRLERLGALQSVSLAISASPDLRLTLKIILDHVIAQLAIDAADVLLLDETDNMLSLAASAGFLATAVPVYRLPIDEGLPGRVMSSRRIETVTALGAFSQFRRRSLFAREGFKAYGAVPLMSRGRLLGALEIFHRSALTPDEEWASFLDALGSVAAVAIDNASMQERLRRAQTAPAPRRVPSPPAALSKLEVQILHLMVEGMTNREIASQVHLSQNTIKFHVRQILQKTGTSNRTELAHQAAKEGWL
ncbi:MAG TPA: GAF domain-containing protein [Candidatus Dormibacteraeota bacterium]|nr:GAF domain-containing protein [Candidatus Dormibacteraeota bacterium]